MTLLMAFGEYVAKMAVFVVVAAAGIAIGIKLRKSKNAKEQLLEEQE